MHAFSGTFTTYSARQDTLLPMLESERVVFVGPFQPGRICLFGMLPNIKKVNSFSLEVYLLRVPLGHVGAHLGPEMQKC